MMEGGLEVRETKSDLSEILLVFSAAADDAKEVWGTVVVAGVLSAETHVLVLAHEWHVVGFLFHPLKVEHLVSVGAFDLVLSPVGRGVLEIKAKLLTLAHGANEIRTNKISDFLGRLATKSLLEDLGAKRGKLTLVLHEGANVALFVPDEQVLVGSMSVADGFLELLEVVGGPRAVGNVSFDHCVDSVLIRK